MKLIFLISLLFALSSGVQAQPSKKKTPSRNALAPKKKPVAWNTPVHAPAVQLNSINTAAAKTNTGGFSVADHYAISDPIIQALNERAHGNPVNIGPSGIVGMPKRAYGFANGHISLAANGSTTSGTQTGSGGVGTGSSLGSLGSSGPWIQMNGKTIGAGSSMWGNSRGLRPPSTDSIGKKY